MSATRLRAPGLVAIALLCTAQGRYFTATRGERGSDSVLFAYIGQGWANGLLPYRDLWDHKPPGVFFIDALLSHPGTDFFLLLACAEFLFILGTLFLVYRLGRELGAQAEISVCCAAILCNLNYYNQNGGLTETFLLLPEVASALCFLRFRATRRASAAVLCGLFAGGAALLKPVGLAPLLAALALLAIEACTKRSNLQFMCRTALLMLSGVVLAWLPAVLYFRARGLLGEMMFASFTYNFRYAGTGEQGIHKLGTLSMLGPVQWLAVCALMLAPVFWSCRREARSRSWSFVFLWTLADVCGGVTGGRYYPHYFLPAMPGLSLCAGVVVAELMREQRRWRPVLAVMLLAPLLLLQFQDLEELRKPSREAEWRPLTEAINNDKGATSTMFCWDYLPWLYFETGLHSPTRHLFAFRMGTNLAFDQEVLHSIQERPATYLAVRSGHERDPGLAGLLASSYLPWRRSGGIAVYKLTPSAAVSASR
jgi:hypothetical protein